MEAPVLVVVDMALVDGAAAVALAVMAHLVLVEPAVLAVLDRHFQYSQDPISVH
jgi:hypothetical protein